MLELDLEKLYYIAIVLRLPSREECVVLFRIEINWDRFFCVST